MKQYGILAYPAKNSLSPAICNAAFKEFGIDGQYDVFEIPKDELDEFIKRVRVEPIFGLSVSSPYKQEIMRYLDEISDDAREISAVNTVVNKNGVLYGDNTDFIGSTMALEEVVGDLKNKTCVVLGAGGAALAIAYGLLKKGAYVRIKDRTRSKADDIAFKFGKMFGDKIRSDSIESMEHGNIFINATSIWHKNPNLTPDNLPSFCNLDYLKNFEVVMDISYNVGMTNFKDPFITPLLMRAKEAGNKIITGDRMLLYQAAEQFKLWTGKDAPIEAMEDAL
jgi:shikimate dehydrogenase